MDFLINYRNKADDTHPEGKECGKFIALKVLHSGKLKVVFEKRICVFIVLVSISLILFYATNCTSSNIIKKRCVFWGWGAGKTLRVQCVRLHHFSIRLKNTAS